MKIPDARGFQALFGATKQIYFATYLSPWYIALSFGSEGKFFVS